MPGKYTHHYNHIFKSLTLITLTIPNYPPYSSKREDLVSILLSMLDIKGPQKDQVHSQRQALAQEKTGKEAAKKGGVMGFFKK